MRHIRVFSTALVVLSVAGSAVVHAQSRGGPLDRQNHGVQQSPHDQRGHVSLPAQQQRPQQEQARRPRDEQRRDDLNRQHVDPRTVARQQQLAQIEQERRLARDRAEQEHAAQIREQERLLQIERNRANDRYVNTSQRYRYNIGGNYHQTNQYGADMLRRAVDDGYQEGVRAGRDDRQDRRQANYRNSPAYRDANFGYGGNYVDQSDYAYYFRQGFQRGYEDGYNNSSRYGSSLNGMGSIFGNVLTSVLGLQSSW